MKHWKPVLCAVLSAALLTACGAPAPAETDVPAPQTVTFTDALGYEAAIESWERVVSLYGSFAETWMLAGGALVGTTSDALEERQLDLGEGVAVVGTVKSPNLEEIIAADPDFILVTTMGASDEAAMAFMADTFESNPAWTGLSAVRNGRYVLLPRDLFHYKPNARWGESYAYLAKILYPGLAAKLP